MRILLIRYKVANATLSNKQYPRQTDKGENNMIYMQDLPDYSNDMYLKGFSPIEILEAMRRTNRKKQKQKREESILEKEMFNFIEGMA